MEIIRQFGRRQLLHLRNQLLTGIEGKIAAIEIVGEPTGLFAQGLRPLLQLIDERLFVLLKVRLLMSRKRFSVFG